MRLELSQTAVPSARSPAFAPSLTAAGHYRTTFPLSQRGRPWTPHRMRHLFDRLASVECQLLLQCLDNISRLRAARCSRALRAVASHPFSWKYAEPVILRSSQLDARLPLLESSLLRLAPIHLHTDRELESVGEAVAIPRLRGLASVRWTPIFPGHDNAHLWTELLTHPSTQQLQTLHCHTDDTLGRHMALIVRLPHLTSLAFVVGRQEASAHMTPLSDAPALTSVQCVFRYEATADARLATLRALTCMPQLRRLWLSTPPFAASSVGETHFTSLPSFFTSPNLSHLTHLTLQGLELRSSFWDSVPPTLDECAAAFSALQRLTHLRIICAGAVDLLLPCLARSRSLQWLAVCVSDAPDSLATQPSVDVLRSVVDTAPLLHVCLIPLGFKPTADSWPDHAACTQLPRVTVAPRISSFDLPQDVY